MNHDLKNPQYYCLTARQDLISGFQVPLYNDGARIAQQQAGFARLVDTDLIAMRKVRQGKVERDWERVCHLAVSVPRVGEWFFPEDGPRINDSECPTRDDFIALLAQYAGPKLGEHFNDYFHQQGFDALTRTFVSSLLQQQYNTNNSKSIKSLKEVANGYAVGTYIKITAPGLVEYEMYNAYSHQRIDSLEDGAGIKEKELPLYVRLRGQISYDPKKDKVSHEIKEFSFIVNQQYQDDLKDFLSLNDPLNRRPDLLRLFVPAPKKELPPFLVEAKISENQNLIDFTQRFLAGAIKMRRSSSPTAVQDIERMSIDIQSLSDKVILKPVTAHVDRPSHTLNPKKNS